MLHYLVTLILGALLTLAYAPFSLWFITPILLAGFMYALLKAESPFKTGFVFGMGWFGTGISWVHVSIAEFGGLPLVGSLGLMVILCAYLALFPATFAWVLKRFVHQPSWLFAAPLIWFVIENIRSWLLTGFPWLSVGYSQIDGPLSGWIPVIGETGLSVLLLGIATSIAIGFQQKRFAPPAVVLIVSLVSGWALNHVQWSQPTQRGASIAMVQGNIKQEMRWAPEQEGPTMQKYLDMTDAHWNNTLVIWPEAAVPQLESIAENYLLALDQKAVETDTGLITGIVNYHIDRREAYNHLLGLGKYQTADSLSQYQYMHSNRYNKHHLLPIGEFIPFEQWLRKLAPIFDLPMSSFTRGNYLQPNLQSNGFLLAPAICFEIAFPRQIAANLNDKTDYIITVSNDAWFGASHGPDQHLEIAQVRAKEFGLPVLRATNNGITAFIDHEGQIVSRLPQFEAGVLSAQIATTEGYTPYRTLGDAPLWLLTLIGLGQVLLRRKPR